jgi:DNA primase
MNERAKAAADRIRAEVPITQVLASYGYRIRDIDREQQFQCDLHGTGRDNKPSARVYPDSNSWYCFGCDKTRDPIETVKAKEGVAFWRAVKILEEAYGLPALPIDYGVDDRPQVVGKVAAALLDPTLTYEHLVGRVRSALDARTINKDAPREQVLRLWEKFDEVVFQVENKVWPEDKGRVLLHGLLGRVNEATRA